MLFCVTTLLVASLNSQFADDFDLAVLHKRWRWHAPSGGEYSLKDNRGWLRISLPKRKGGFNHWHGVFDAPMLLTDVEGNFAIQTRMRLVKYADANFHTGLVVAHSTKYLTIFGPYCSPALWKMKRPEIWLERTGEGRLAVAPMKSDEISLRVEVRGYELVAFCGAEGDWRRVATMRLWFKPTMVGLIAKTWGDESELAVDFDYFKLEPIETTTQADVLDINVNVDARRRLNEINAMIYGHFIEHLGRCIYGGIWAEMLYNRKFTGTSRDGVVEGWRQIGSGASYSPDNTTFYVGGQAQRIDGHDEQEHGIAQDGLEIEPKAYVGRVVVRGDDVKSITVSLRSGDQILASQKLVGVTNRWRKLQFRLEPKAASSNASFAITFKGKGTLHIGAASLMPADNIYGMRRDVIEAIKAIRPPIIRWPGGNFVSGYHWRDGIGDPDKRPPRWDRAWNAWEWNDFGTDEFIRFCKLVGCEPYICVNAGEGYADEAAEWVEYCNGSPDTRWGSVRALNGNREPYKVRYFGIGNEMYGNWQLGHLDAVKYALKSIEFALAMKRVDRSIKLIEVGVDGAGWNGWNEKVVKIAGAHFDMLSVHYYQGYNANDDPLLIYTTVASAPARIERMLNEVAQIIEHNKPKGKRITIAFDEWNVWMPHQTAQAGLEGYYTLRDGIFAAGVFHALHRLGGIVEMANLAQLVNVLGAIRTTQTKLLLTPIYHAFAMYVHGTGKWRLQCEYDSPKLSSPTAADVDAVDLSATLSEDGKRLFIAAINRHPEMGARLHLKIDGFKPKESVWLELMTSASFNDANKFESPDVVKPRRERISLDDAFKFTLPKHSIAILQFEAKS